MYKTAGFQFKFHKKKYMRHTEKSLCIYVRQKYAKKIIDRMESNL